MCAVVFITTIFCYVIVNVYLAIDNRGVTENGKRRI